MFQISSFQENVPNDAAEPAASRICLFLSPFLRESGGRGGGGGTVPFTMLVILTLGSNFPIS